MIETCICGHLKDNHTVDTLGCADCECITYIHNGRR
jgi:hypothetical protein